MTRTEKAKFQRRSMRGEAGQVLLVTHPYARRCSSSLRMKALSLLTLSFFLPNLFAQTSLISGAMAPMALYINILEGEDALNNIHDRTAREPIVQVTDENHQPVKGATVTFSDVAGATGAGATFGGALTYSVVTGADGKAVGHGFHPNTVAGRHEVEVAAAIGMLAATILIHETNVLRGAAVLGPGHGTLAGLGGSAWFIGEFAAGVAGVATYLGVTHDTSVAQFTAATPAAPTAPAPVPEIDPSVAFGSIAMLAGAAAVLRRRSE